MFSKSIGVAAVLLLSRWATAAPTSVEIDSELDGIVALRAAAAEGTHWVDTWTSMPQLVESSNMPPSPYSSGGVFKDATLRQTLHLSIGAERLRIQISNTFGGSDLPITAASIAFPTGGKAGVAGIDTSTLKQLTFKDGAESITIPKGQVAYTDPIDFKVDPQTMITVSLYSKAGQSGSSITGHPGSRTTSYMQTGNQVNASTIAGASAKHWYFVSAVEAWAPADTSALVILGDSITDGRGSTDDANNRWPDLLLARMQKAGLNNIGVNNQAAGGNTVLSGGLGPPLLTRYKRDGITQQGVKYVLIFEGVNDIGGGATDAGSQNGIASRLQDAFKQIATECRAAGIKVFAATITPFGGSGQSYSNPTREQTRVKVNAWILANAGGIFDGVVDFSKMIGDASTKSQLAKAYDGGDHLHPNVAGYQAMADGFPLDIFK
ncbi:SGNH hydrolase-type esterase domain-containing protein [Podospora appendiculata]|uniref:SGNH hydrolase-type esterase domain-containing protein n=1 Tax=Podospora appendiculata TaxID=314037 RepID=A0AAE1CA65_9PEZI|nr:SGNH hydrolase-type esterase domain-containing protein [Podospora appendiculata]